MKTDSIKFAVSFFSEWKSSIYRNCFTEAAHWKETATDKSNLIRIASFFMVTCNKILIWLNRFFMSNENGLISIIMST